MVKLSRRLSQIAAFVPHGSTLADIGTDHALLPVYLVEHEIIRRAVAGELNEGPYEAARQQVLTAGLTQRIDVRRGDGLSVIMPGEVDTVTIAGMGGALITEILNAGLPRLKGVDTLILQPNVAEDAVRRWLLEHDYVLVEEAILTEDGVTYEILHAKHARIAPITNDQVYKMRRLPNGRCVNAEDALRFGPYLLERLEEPFIAKWREEMEKLERIRKQIASHADSPHAELRLREIDQEIERITEVLQCSRMDKPSSR
jgi:tRNA (adenine22-N1)-methyltransferase